MYYPLAVILQLFALRQKSHLKYKFLTALLRTTKCNSKNTKHNNSNNTWRVLKGTVPSVDKNLELKLNMFRYHHAGVKGERSYSSYLFLTWALDGASGQRHVTAALYPRERTPVPTG
jgi:hypothetical protein